MARYVALLDGETGAYGVSFPELPGCVAMGSTVDEALANAAEALRDWMDLIEDQGHIPAPRPAEDLRGEPEVVEALREGASLAVIPLVRDSGKPAKANLSIDAGILAAIDEEARRRKLTRSALIELMARRTLPALM